jgi:hypothetical protein
MKNTAKAARTKDLSTLKKSEVWYQDPEDSNLWHGTHGVIVNTAALVEREFFYNITRVVAPGTPSRGKRSSQSAVYA